MTEQQALQIVKERCSKTGTCHRCPYMRDDICEVRKTLTTTPKKETKKNRIVKN